MNSVRNLLNRIDPAEIFNLAIDSLRWANCPAPDYEMLNYWCRRYHPIEDEE